MAERDFDPTETEPPGAVTDARRLEAIERSGLLSLQDTATLDQLISVIRDVLGVPVALVSVVSHDRQVFPIAQGLPEPWQSSGETPLSHSFCQHVVTSELPLQVDDAPANTLLCDNLAIRDLGVQAYLGTPIRDPDGFILGSLCAIDTQPRKWTARDLGVLEAFSATITTQLLARQALSEQRRYHQELIRQQEKLKRVTNTASVMLAELSTDFAHTFANRSYAELFDKSPDAIIGRHPRELMGSKAYALVEPKLNEALSGKAIQFDLEMPQTNGKSRILRVHYAPECDDAGHVQGLVAAVTDITEQRLLSTLAEQLDDRLKAAHQMSLDGFMVFRSLRDDTGRIFDFEWEFANEPGAKIAGRSVEDLLGCRLLSVLPGNKNEGLFDAYVGVVNSGQPFETTVFYDHDDLSLWIEISAIKLGDGFAVSFSDVSERKRAELALADSANRLQRILDNVVAFVGILTPDGILTEANQPALDVAGLSRQDVVGKPFWDAYWWSFSPESQERVKQAIRAAQAGHSSRYDAPIRISEHDTIWIDFQLVPQFDANGKVVEMIPSGTDITERKRAETHRELLVNELNHRVKNSLATIQAMARHTIRGAKDMHSFEESFSARLKAISMAHDILVSSDNAKADLATMINRQVGPYVDGANQLRVSCDAAILDAECAHSVGLALHELATNAAKYGALSTPEGYVDISSVDMGDGTVKITWTEVAGPPVAQPDGKGFGSRLIKQSIEYALGGTAKVEYAPGGVVATLIVPTEFDHG